MTKRDIIDGLKSALRTMGAAGITGSEAMQAFAEAHQLVGRLEADLMEEQRRAAYASARAARLPRSVVETIDPDLPEEQVESALHLAVRTIVENSDERLDEIEAGLQAYLIERGMARSF